MQAKVGKLSRRELVIGLSMVMAIPSMRTSATALMLPIDATEVLDLAQNYSKAQMNKDPGSIAALFFDDGLYQDTQNPKNGLRRGRGQIEEYFNQLYHSYPQLVFSIDSVAIHSVTPSAQTLNAGVMWSFDGVHEASTDIAGAATSQRVRIVGYDQLVVSRNQDSTLLIKAALSYYNGEDFAAQDAAEG